ncbi:RNA polymerase sigma factor sigF, chloroplastic [Olea europaea subsp. europaea]|nr:RNA polymerase sigma factor sigF, chloroplastic [Olea europaea subsp. europaea]
MIHEQVAPAITSFSASSLGRHFPSSILIQEQYDKSQPLLQQKEDITFQATLDRRLMEPPTGNEVNNILDSEQYVNDFQLQFQHWPALWYLLPSLQTKEAQSLPMTVQPILSKEEKVTGVEPQNVVSLAGKAFSASREAALIAESTKLLGVNLDDSHNPRGLVNNPIQDKRTVRSTRLLERKTKRRRLPKSNLEVQENNHPGRSEGQRKIGEGFDPNDPLRLFLGEPETRKLLTAKEESELIVKIQELMRLEEVKGQLQTQFSREPTLSEWADAVGLSCQTLQSHLQCGKRSREKLIYANFRMVVHIAKQYQGRGLSLQDLLQEGSMGLMRTVEKFKPQAGCRFATYAYWWIRQAIRKAIFQHSRTIRLPENVYGLLSKVKEAKTLCIQRGNHHPVKEEIAATAGITVEKLDKLLFTARMPLSMQQPIWMDQDTTFQEITADARVEVPDVSVAKQLMRQHVRNLLSVLSPKERKIIRLRFGIENDKQKSLSEIGTIFGLSKERVRQLESRALYKLKQCLDSQGLEAYADMII